MTIRFDGERGLLVLDAPQLDAPLAWRAGITTTRESVFLQPGEVRSTTESSAIFPGGTVLRCEQGPLLWNVHTGGAAFALEIGLRDARDPVERFILFDGPAAGASMLRLAYCGAHSRSPLSMSSVVALDETTNETSWWCTAFAANDTPECGTPASPPAGPAPSRRRSPEWRRDAAGPAAETAAFRWKRDDIGGRGLVLGFLSALRLAGAIDVAGRTCRAYNFGERITGDTVWSEPLLIAPAADVASQLQAYAEHVARLAGAPPPKPPVAGWASWLQYGVDFDAATVLENADELARWFDGEPERLVVHIDHGWEKRVRLHRPDLAWEPRPEFASDLRTLASALAAKNLRTGLWVVPFAINVGAEGAERHLDHVVRGADGAPKLVGAGQNYCIDPTHPEGERWLRELFHRLRGWGASYFKLEYLRLLLCPEPFDPHDGFDSVRVYARAKTRAEAYRYGLGVIRDAVGPGTYLLGCGAPALPGAGLVDSHRVGGDIERWWFREDRTGVRACARNAAANFFWNGRAWRNDPDVLAAFDEENLLRFWTTTVALSGGNTIASAPLARLSERQRAALRAAMPSLGVSAIPRAADLWQLALGDHDLLAFFNSTDEAREMTADVEETSLAWDFWNDRPVAVDGTALRLHVPPRDAALVSVRARRPHPQLLASTLHYGMGAHEIAHSTWDAAGLRLATALTAARRSGSLAFHVPAPFRLVRSSAAFEETGAETVRVRIGENSDRSIEMEFTRER